MLALNSHDEFRLTHLFGFFCSVKNPTAHFYTEMKYLSFYCKSWKVAVPGHLGDISKGFMKEISIFLLSWPYRILFPPISKLCVGRLESSHWRMVTCHASWETCYQAAFLRACGGCWAEWGSAGAFSCIHSCPLFSKAADSLDRTSLIHLCWKTSLNTQGKLLSALLFRMLLKVNMYIVVIHH